MYRHQAELAQGLLQDEGIEAFVVADDLGGYRPDVSLGMGNVKLCVTQQNLEKARQILASLGETPEE